jgi:hypothetical protein
VLFVLTSATSVFTLPTCASALRSAQVLGSAGLFGANQSAVLAGSCRHDWSVRTSLPWCESGVGGSILGGAPPLLMVFGASESVFGAGGWVFWADALVSADLSVSVSGLVSGDVPMSPGTGGADRVTVLSGAGGVLAV